MGVAAAAPSTGGIPNAVRRSIAPALETILSPPHTRTGAEYVAVPTSQPEDENQIGGGGEANNIFVKAPGLSVDVATGYYAAEQPTSMYGESNSIESDDTPRTFEEYLESPRRSDWTAGMQSEMQSHEENGTWYVIEWDGLSRILKGKWVYKIKRDENGTIIRFKCRWVACGYAQRAGVDYGETHAPVV